MPGKDKYGRSGPSMNADQRAALYNKTFGRAVAKLTSAAKKGSRKKGGRRSNSPAVISPAIRDYMSLVMNPCHGPLVRAVGTVVPGQVVERVRDTITIDPSLGTSGYVVWFPSYHAYAPSAYGNSVKPANCFVFQTSTPGTAPVNTTAAPMGTGASFNAVNGLFVSDPLGPQLSSSSAFSRGQALAACVQVESLAPLSTMSGQVSIVSNLSLAAFNRQSGSASNFTPMSVDEIFAYAAVRERLNLAGHEVKWRPSDHSAVMRTNGYDDAGFPTGASTVADAVFLAGVPTTATTEECATDPASVNGICIAWRSIPADSNSFIINLIKVGALELSARNNQIEQVPTGASPASTASTIDVVVNILDRTYRGAWQIGKGVYDTMSFASGAARGVGRALSAIENVYAPRLRASPLRALRDM